MNKKPFLVVVLPLFLAACGGSTPTARSGSGMMGGSTPPTAMSAAFMSVSPRGGTVGVSPEAPLSFRFGGPMAPGMEQYFDLHRGGLDGPIVPMSCTWAADRATLTCSPGAPLQPRTAYTIHMGGGLTDASGLHVGYDAYGPMMGGQWVQGGTMPGLHGGGMGWGMMGSGWRHANGTYGMVFSFTTE